MNIMIRSILIFFIFGFLVSGFAQDKLTEFRRDSILWNRAGITTNFIPSSQRLVSDTLTNMSQIQKQLTALSASGGGKLIIPEGIFELVEAIRIPSNVSIVGTSRETSIIQIKLREQFEKSKHGLAPEGNVASFIFDHCLNSSIENLTLVYNPVDFEPMDFNQYDHEWVGEVFNSTDERIKDLFVTTIWFENASNCLLNNTNILQAGNDPVRIQYSNHITCANNFIDRAYNKSDGGAGYYNLMYSDSCLLFREKVRRIRHLCIHRQSSYNVVYGCELEVDVNFHNGDSGHNLIENNSIRIPTWHGWHCFSTGVPSMHQPPGPSNVLYRNSTDYKGSGQECDPTKLYLMEDHYTDPSKGQERLRATGMEKDFPNGIFNARLAKGINENLFE